MKDKILSRTLRIEDDRRAAAFSAPLRRRLVLALVPREQSVKELSDSLGVEMKRLHYHVTMLVKLELVIVAREQPRAGRPVKFYRAASSSFFVPDSVASTAPTDALVDGLRESLQRQRERSSGGFLYDTDAGGRLRMRRVEAHGRRPVAAIEQWRLMRLSRADAARLVQELSECVARYAGSPSGQAHLVHLAVAPHPAGAGP
ncbi:MAG: winged helix-turn-helix domain-containing protein [Pseudomonadota bacterium]|nr:winged helix-turn-helix domain-containing protein [Pseudomonadota bacterium]